MKQPLAHILVVDDDEEVLIWSSYILRSEGYRVITAKSTAECLKRLDEVRPDLVVMDLHLPDVSGLMATRMIRQRYETRDVPVLVYSATPEVRGREEAKTLGATDYIEKPCPPFSLLARVKTILSHFREESSSRAASFLAKE